MIGIRIESRIPAYFLALVVALSPLMMFAQSQVPPDVQQAAASLVVRNGHQFRPVASEPLVVDPVSAKLDRLGRLWVVEMPDYPIGPRDGEAPRGTIKILQDGDGDGLFDTATLFATGLSFATGVLPYRDGAFATVGGEIVFIRDLDQDGVGDQSEVLFRGFAEQNQQLRANHPTLGPDGMVYVANGLRGGSVVSASDRYDSRESPLDLRGRDFVFDPDGGWWGAVTGNSQFGLSVDDFGRRIGCSNRNPAMMAVLDLDSVSRDPWIALRDAIHDVSLAAEQSKVVARGDAWTTSNLHSGQFSAACGVLAAGRSDDRAEWILVCEPTAYLVQRQRVQREGSVWVASREQAEQEFLASSNTWFRPVDMASGPGSSCYVVDIARAVIEHPDFMPVELKSRTDQRDGETLGRIWQVSKSGHWPAIERLESPEQAATWLQSQSPWQRQSASRFFLESTADHSQILRSLLHAPGIPTEATARALWVLERKGQLPLSELKQLATASDARLRALAVQLAASRSDGMAVIAAAAQDQDLLVLRSVAEAVAAGGNDRESRVEVLAVVAKAAANDHWVRRTIASMHDDLLLHVARRLTSRSSETDGAEPENTLLLSHLVRRIALSSPEVAARLVIEALPQGESSPSSWTDSDSALWLAWMEGCRRARLSVSKALARLSESEQAGIKGRFRVAAELALDQNETVNRRADALRVALATGTPPSSLRSLLDEETPPQLRRLIVGPLLRSENDQMRDYLRDNLVSMTLQVRAASLEACSARAADARWLLDEIEAGKVPRTIIDPDLAKRLRNHPDESVSTAATRLLQADPNRARVLASYASSARDLGDPIRGRKLFQQHCAACHRMEGVGTNVGPDISDTRTKTPDALLNSILDHNAAIDSAFVQYQVLTADGRILDGLLVDETADAVTLQQKGGQRIAITRADIEQVRAPGVSLMPEGFEQTIDPAAMSHLLSYLKNWRYLNRSIPGTLRN